MSALRKLWTTMRESDLTLHSNATNPQNWRELSASWRETLDTSACVRVHMMYDVCARACVCMQIRVCVHVLRCMSIQVCVSVYVKLYIRT